MFELVAGVGVEPPLVESLGRAKMSTTAKRMIIDAKPTAIAIISPFLLFLGFGLPISIPGIAEATGPAGFPIGSAGAPKFAPNPGPPGCPAGGVNGLDGSAGAGGIGATGAAGGAIPKSGAAGACGAAGIAKGSACGCAGGTVGVSGCGGVPAGGGVGFIGFVGSCGGMVFSRLHLLSFYYTYHTISEILPKGGNLLVQIANKIIPSITQATQTPDFVLKHCVSNFNNTVFGNSFDALR